MNRTHRTARPLQAFLLTTGLTVSAVSAQAQLAYVSSEKDNALAIVDVKTQSVVGHIPTCKRPRHMALSADRKQLMTACGDSGQLDVIDLATRKSLRRVSLGEDPEAFDLSPDGQTGSAWSGEGG